LKVATSEKILNKFVETKVTKEARVNLSKRMIQIIRDDGIKSLWFKILGEIGYRRLILVTLHLDEPTEKAKTRLPVEFSMLHETDLDKYLHFRPDQTASEINNRFMAGHLCFVGRYEGSIVYACWAARQVARIDYLSLDLGLAADEIYTYDTFTLPGFRGKNVFPAGIEYTLRYFRKAGFRKYVGCVLPENRPAVHTLSKSGYLRFGMIGYIGLGRSKWKFRRHFKTSSSLI